MCRVGVNNYIICRRLYVHVCEYAIRKRCVFNKVLKEKAKKHSEYSREFSILREQLRKDPKISLRKPIDCCRSQKYPCVQIFSFRRARKLKICTQGCLINSGQTHKQTKQTKDKHPTIEF